jgi:DNA-binding transcriptional MerR regulator
MPIARERRVDFLKSGEVAELLGVTKQTLLNWLRRGLITEPERNPATGYRLWTEKDIERVRRMLRERSSS